MLFLILLTIGALGLAGSAIFFSVLGLVQTFSATALIWGSAIESSKLLTASFLTQYWNRIGKVTKTLGIVFVVALMLITSAGIYGHIISSYQEGTVEVDSQQIQLDEAQQNVDRLKERIESIDQNIESAENDIDKANEDISTILARDDAYITARTRQADTIREDRAELEERLETLLQRREELTQQHQEYQDAFLERRSDKLQTEAKVGPIITIISILGDDIGERAMLWFVLLIVLVFDPVAVYLTIQVNRVAMFLKEDGDKEDKTPSQEHNDSEQEDTGHLNDSIQSLNEKLSGLVKSTEENKSKLNDMEKSISKSEKKSELKKGLMSD